MKKLLMIIVFLSFAACAVHMGPHGLSIDPLFPTIVIGTPVVVAPPQGVVASPLPPVVVVPGRDVYFYNNFYYYSWQGGWYWSRHQQGPWHVLPKDRWPKRGGPRR